MLPDYIDSSGGFSIRKQETAIPNYRAEYRRRAATRYHSESGSTNVIVVSGLFEIDETLFVADILVAVACQFLLPDR